MTDRIPDHEDHEFNWVVIAQAEGLLSVQEQVTITEAADTLRNRARALGVPVEHVARDLVAAAQSRANDNG